MTYPFFGPPYTKPPPPAAQYQESVSAIGSLPFTTVSQVLEADYSDLQTALNTVGSGIFYVLGNYEVTDQLYNSADGQIVIFEPGTSLSTTQTTGIVISPGETATHTAAYNLCKWLGYGVSFNPTSSVSLFNNTLTFATGDSVNSLELAGFVAGGLAYNWCYLQPSVTATSQSQMYQFTGMYIHDAVWIGNANTASGAVPFSTVLSLTKFERCYADGSQIGAVDYSLFFLLGHYMPTITWMVFGQEMDDCVAIANSTGVTGTGQVVELKGGGGNNSTTTINTNITLRNCILFSPSSSPVGPANGGLEIDDNVTGGGTTFHVTNITFDGCQFWNIEIGYQPTASYFGYIRFKNCMNNGAPGTPTTTGTMTGRSAGSQVGITVGTSPFTYTNDDGFDEWVFLTAGTVSAFALDGVTIYSSTGRAVLLHAGHNITITYSALPTLTKQGIGG